MREPVSKRHPMIDMEEFERRLRRRSSGNQTDDDPLAELARLTSGQQRFIPEGCRAARPEFDRSAAGGDTVVRGPRDGGPRAR